MKTVRNSTRNRKFGQGMKFRSLIFLFVLGAAAPVWAQSSENDKYKGEEYRVKAGFIFNFAKFVEWPEESFKDKDSPILLCVFPPDIFNSIPFIRSIGGREILIKPYQDDEDMKCCHILFLSGSDRIQEKLNAVKDKKGILTVGESEDFNRMGGIIAFVLLKEKKRLTFDINLNAANQSGLKLRSQLLSSAQKVEGSP